MNSTPRLVVLALGLVAMVAACEDDGNIPPPPEKPEQIKISRSYTRSNGLPSSDVTSFLTLSNGEFWIGTFAGVARYASFSDDGSVVVNEVNGLPHPQVTNLVEYTGTVYVGTWGGGLGVYDIAGGTWSQIRPAETGLTDGFISGISTSPSEDLLYMSTNNGVFTYNPTTGTFTHISTVGGEPPVEEDDLETPQLQQVVSTVEVQEDAGVVQRWYGPRVEVRIAANDLPFHGIIVSRAATTYKYSRANSGLLEPNVNDIFYDAVSNTFWVGYVSKGISQVDVAAKTWKSYDLVQGLPSNTVMGITRAKDNASSGTVIWAGTQDGLAKLVGNRWQGYGVSGGLPSNRVRSVYSDDGEHLWVGFVDAGAVRIH